MTDRCRKGSSRREFITTAGKGIAASAAIGGFPSIVPASVFGAFSPSNRINVGAIGTGRISRAHDLPGIWRHDVSRIMAVCDLDGKRVQDAKALVNEQYAKKTGKPYDGVTDVRQLPRVAGEQRRRRGRDQHSRSLAYAHRDRCRRGREGRLSAEAGIVDHC